MIKKDNTINLLSLGLIVFSLISLVLRTVALFTAFDSHIGYFDTTAAITFFDRSFFAIAIFFGIVASFLTQKSSVLITSPSNLWSIFASLILGFIWMVSALLIFIIGGGKISTFGYISLASAVCSAIYYIYEGFRPIKALNNGRTLAALVPTIALISMIFIENFDFTVALNNPDKQLMMFAFILAALFIIQKLKLSTEAPSNRLYICSAYLTVFISLYFAIPGIIGNLAHVTDDPKYLVYYLLSLGIAIYSAIDLFGRIKLSSIGDASAPDISEK